MTKIIIENSPTLVGERIYLRKMKESDRDAMFHMLKDIEVNTFLPWFPMHCIEEVDVFLKKNYLDTYMDKQGYHYAICLKDNDQLLGYIQVSDEESHDLGYGILKEYWHHGYASEAALLLLHRLKEVGYPYITATHDRNNPRSGEVMKRLKMTYRYSYVEQWMPKDKEVVFRMYQLNIDGNDRLYDVYQNAYPSYVEENV